MLNNFCYSTPDVYLDVVFCCICFNTRIYYSSLHYVYVDPLILHMLSLCCAVTVSFAFLYCCCSLSHVYTATCPAIYPAITDTHSTTCHFLYCSSAHMVRRSPPTIPWRRPVLGRALHLVWLCVAPCPLLLAGTQSLIQCSV